MKKIILDTNVLISGFVFRGRAAEVMEHCLLNEQVFLSPFILGELTEKLRGKFRMPEADLAEILFLVAQKSVYIKPTGELPTVCRDPDDNNVLQLAAFVEADFLITGDKDLLVLENFGGTKICSPTDFLTIFLKN